MTLVKDVIYNLKLDSNYSQPMTVKKDIFTFDPKTGLNTKDSGQSISQYIQNVILLPLNIRQAFFRAIQLQKEGYLKPGESQVAVDVDDLRGITVTPGFFFVDRLSIRYDVAAVENIRGEALLITLKSPE